MATAITLYGQKTKTIQLDPEDRFQNDTFAIENINWIFTAKNARNAGLEVQTIETVTGDEADDQDINAGKIVVKSDLFRSVISADKKTAVVTTTGVAGTINVTVSADSNLDPTVIKTVRESVAIKVRSWYTTDLNLNPATLGDVFTDLDENGIDDIQEQPIYGTASHIFKLSPVDIFGNTTTIKNIDWTLTNTAHPTTNDPNLMGSHFATINPSESEMSCVLRPTGKQTDDNISLSAMAEDSDFIKYTAPDTTVFYILPTEQILKYTTTEPDGEGTIDVDHYVLAGTQPAGVTTTVVDTSLGGESGSIAIQLSDESIFQINPATVESLNITIS